MFAVGTGVLPLKQAALTTPGWRGSVGPRGAPWLAGGTGYTRYTTHLWSCMQASRVLYYIITPQTFYMCAFSCDRCLTHHDMAECSVETLGGH